MLSMLFLFAEGFVLIWRHGETIVAVGSQVIRDQEKYRLEGGEFGYTLLVSLADEGDAGNYSCQISSFNPSILNHSVSIRSKSGVDIGIALTGLVNFAFSI